MHQRQKAIYSIIEIESRNLLIAESGFDSLGHRISIAVVEFLMPTLRRRALVSKLFLDDDPVPEGCGMSS